MGLTIKGIHILRDVKGNLKKVIEDFNKDRLDELREFEEARKFLKEKNIIEYFNSAIEAINKYNIDSQGFFECIRAIIEQVGIKIEKIWKKDNGDT